MRQGIRFACIFFGASICLMAASCGKMTAKAVPTPSPKPEARLFIAGDALLTRLPGRRLREGGYPALFSKMKGFIEEADAAFLNLETPISTLGVPFPGKPSNVTFRADPIAAFALRDAGIDVVSLANNHMNDHGPLALAETLDYLDMAGIAHAGAGKDLPSAHSPAFVTAGEWRIGFLAYSQPWWSVTEAGPSSPGVAHAIPETIISDIDVLRASGKADFIAVSLHWGEEFAKTPDEFQIELAHACIDAGADLVLGHHPHVLQGMERRGRGVIFYSLGNFVFDMADDSTYDSVAAFVSLGTDGLGRVELLPVLISRAKNQPSPATGADWDRISSRLMSLSAALGDSPGTFLVQEGDRLVSLPM